MSKLQKEPVYPSLPAGDMSFDSWRMYHRDKIWD